MLWPLSFVMNRIFYFFLALLIYGCNSPDSKEILEYKGPVNEVEDVELYYSENDKVTVKMLADLLYTFEIMHFTSRRKTNGGAVVMLR